MPAYIANATHCCEVVKVDHERGVMTLLEWPDVGYGVMFDKRISEIQAEGFEVVQ